MRYRESPREGVRARGYSAPPVDANVIDANPVSSRPVGIPRRFYRLWPWLPLPVGIAYLLLLLAFLPRG